MSVDYYVTCTFCNEKIHVAQDGLGGFSFYSGDPKCMTALGKFFENHILHEMHIFSEQFCEDYKRVDWGEWD